MEARPSLDSRTYFPFSYLFSSFEPSQPSARPNQYNHHLHYREQVKEINVI